MAIHTQTAQTANLLGVLSLLVQDRVQEALTETLPRSPSVAAAVVGLGTWPGLSIDELSRVLGLSHSATVRVVESLVSDRIVQKTAGNDRRSVSLRLTRSGRRLFDRLREQRRAVLYEILEKLTARERGELHEALVRILEDCASTVEEARHLCRLCEHAVCRTCPVRKFAAAEAEA